MPAPERAFLAIAVLLAIFGSALLCVSAPLALHADPRGHQSVNFAVRHGPELLIFRVNPD